ncbi:MAG: histidine phosphotransferase family protein [Pseudomonadota bacterium]
MPPTSNNLAALLSSRICHDLVSPIGAIANGVELMQMAGGNGGPELDLISESVENANARIRFFRIAFGVAAHDQRVPIKEIRDILADVTRGTRLQIDWQSDTDLLRSEVKLIFLLLLCFETAMPWGGKIVVTQPSTSWNVTGTSDRMKDLGPLWTILRDATTEVDVNAAQVQFLLFPLLLQERMRSINLTVAADRVEAVF